MYYFAYGSNMNHRQMEERCGKVNFKFIGPARLDGYKFVYDGYSKFWDGAVANIIKDENSFVWGGLYEINYFCLDRLDKYEGYPRVYRREKIIVKDDKNNEYKALVYLRDPLPIEKPPAEKYKKIVVDGAKECSLPDDYINKVF